MRTSYDNNALVGHIAQGSAERVLNASKFDAGGQGLFPVLLRFVVLDVIFDPQSIDEVKLSHWENDLLVSNIKYAAVAPRNSIIARRVLAPGSSASENSIVLYPFFTHFAMPAKPGEHVWAMFENPDAKVNELGYWFNRIAEPNFVDDPNYTHSNRQFDPTYMPGTIDTLNDVKPKYDFPNGAVQTDNDGQRYTVGQTSTLVGDENTYEGLRTDSDASKLTQVEAVPRYRKRPGEFTVEGSNNTLVVLGDNDRTSQVADYDSDPKQGNVPKIPLSDMPGEGTGFIDIVVGRGQTSATLGNAVTNSLGQHELGKSKQELTQKEGDLDYKHDRSRLYASLRTKIDEKLKIDNVVKAHSGGTVTDPDTGEGAAVMKSDKVRIVARHDILILVTNATNTDENGRPIEDEDIDPTKCASVLVKTNGDIVFTPSSAGVLKLGGDGASKAILCTSVSSVSSGQVTAQPIIDSMGGAQGGADGLNGTFASKVLVL